MSISLEFLKQAVHIKEQIVALEARLAKMFDGNYPWSPTRDEQPAVQKGRRKMSAAARAKIGAAQRKRWAKKKGTSVAKPAKKKRHLSAAGRAAIIAAQKKRWNKKGK